MSKLGELFTGAPLVEALNPELAGARVAGLAYDSRRAGPGYVFFAFEGQKADGRAFAADAVARGAIAVVSQSEKPAGFDGQWIRVRHGRQALAVAARNFYGKPDERIAIVGITGTNGKTTCSYLIDSVLRAAGRVTLVVGTIEYRLAGKVLPAVNTTPESLDLMSLLAELEGLGGTHATMEVSSHALALGRVFGMRFHTAVFTNLTRDHLDFHGTMEEYFAAKSLLFSGAGAPAPRFAAINVDDPYGRQIPVSGGTEVIRYGLGKRAAVRAINISSTMGGLRFDVEHGDETWPVESNLVGRINVYNILAAASTGLSFGLSTGVIADGIAKCEAVPGRFERIDEGQPFGVIVDYAHTDDALRNTIAVARGITANRVITLFGCGGDRDRSKRPLMGQAAGENSDFVVLTSDNPRSEDPLAIMNDALVGLRRFDTPHVIEPDRAAAIRRAIREARAGDIVILAGKGHETYQVLKDRVIDFDDRAVARKVLHDLGYP